MFRRIFFILLIVLSNNLFSQERTCDSLAAKISGNQAKEIVFEKQYTSYIFKTIEFEQVNGVCCWKVVIADSHSVKHHGHYARTYRTYWIDSTTGAILKQEGVKKIEGYYQE